MFYSRELLARKASLGQIWLLGTMQSKLDRRKANKLDVASLCEEILNPPIPMALRLSSILMGGLVILYEKKVMILHDDANRLLVELRNAWRIMEEPTLLPKRKARAGRKTITLPENEDTEVEDPEDEEHFMGFNQNRVNLQLDQIDEYYIANDPMEDNPTHDNHQADYNDITLLDSFQPDTTIHDQFERFEEGDDGTQQNFSLDCHISTTLVPSPPRQDGPPRAEEIPEQHQEPQCDQQFNASEEARDPQRRPGAVKRKSRKAKGVIIDMEQICIPNHEYQSWLQDTSDIVSRRAKRKRGPRNILSSLKLDKLMELPSTVLMDDMLVKGYQEIPYPAPLLELWKINNQPGQDSPSVKTSQPQPQEPSFPDFPFEDLHSGVGSPSHAVNIEVQRTHVLNNVSTPAEQPTVVSNASSGGTNQLFSHGNSGDGAGNTGSSVSGDGVPPNNLKVNLRRVGSKRNNVPSTSKSNGSLQPVVEVFHEADADYRLSSPQQNNLTSSEDLWVETQPTFEAPANDSPDIINENIKNFLKTHFETPGAPKVESLDNLAAGLNKKGAAQLFYQTCVLASKGFLKVEQRVPFGDISISKGAKM